MRHGTRSLVLSSSLLLVAAHPVARPRLTLRLAADDYARWMPEPGPDEHTPGNRLHLRVHAESSTGEPLPRAVELRLVEVSREPGIATNDPGERLDPAQPVPPDLALPDGKQALRVALVDGNGEADLDAYAGGAWGELEARAVGADGETAVAKLSVPDRVPGTHVASEYFAAVAPGAEDKRCNGKDTDDSDEERDNEEKGDGFTCHEEYRGFTGVLSINGEALKKPEFHRTSVGKKTLVVEIGTAAPWVRGGFGMFASAARVEVYELKKGSLQRGIANPSRSQFRCGPQTGVQVNAYPATDACGDDTPLAGDATTCSSIAVRPCPRPINNSNTVAHELGHCRHLLHHGDGDTDANNTASYIDGLLAANPGRVKVYLKSGAPAPPGYLDAVKKTRAQFGTIGSEPSGDVHCIMTYNHDAQYAVHTSFTGATVYEIDRFPPDGDRFCTSKDGSGYNLSTHRAGPLVVSYFGNAQRGECLQHLRFRDFAYCHPGE